MKETGASAYWGEHAGKGGKAESGYGYGVLRAAGNECGTCEVSDRWPGQGPHASLSLSSNGIAVLRRSFPRDIRVKVSVYLTLGEIVHELARAASSTEAWIQVVTVRARKPSGLSFADFSGVVVTSHKQDCGL